MHLIMEHKVVHIDSEELDLAGDCSVTLAIDKIVGIAVERNHGGATSQAYALHIFTVGETFKFPLKWDNKMPDKDQKAKLEKLQSLLVEEIWGDKRLSTSRIGKKLGL